MTQTRYPYEMLVERLTEILEAEGFEPSRARASAALFVDASRDGTYSHGLNRFPRFVANLRSGLVDPSAEPSCTATLGALERWDGHRGPGNLNAAMATRRAIELARQHTIGVVAMANTNHWMRPGNYGLMAIEAGCIGIFWTNTIPNMPPWGGREARVGNNPIVFAVPGREGPVLLDIAMSMFSYGKMEDHARAGTQLPVDGGFDREQRPTRDPAAILDSGQPLPIGLWKGSGLALMLDLVAAALSGGRSSRQVAELGEEGELSQVFMLIDLERLPDREAYLDEVEATLRALQDATPVEADAPPRYPGQGMMRTREANLREGIPIDDEVWNEILQLAGETTRAAQAEGDEDGGKQD